MAELVFYYLFAGAILSAALINLASHHPFYRPTFLAWLVVALVWPYALIKFIGRLIRG